MSTEITPTLNNLRTERISYQTWLTNNNEIERLERYTIAYTYNNIENKVNNNMNEYNMIVDELQSYKKVENDSLEEVADLTRQISDLQETYNNNNDNILLKYKTNENNLSKDYVKINTLITNQKENLINEQNIITSLHKQYDTSIHTLNTKQTELTTAQEQLTNKETEVTSVDKHCSLLRERYQNACAGITTTTSTSSTTTSDDTSASLLSIPEQVVTWEKRLREAESTLKQGQLKSTHAKTILKDLLKNQTIQAKSQESSISQISTLQSQIITLQTDLTNLNYSEKDEKSVRNDLNTSKNHYAKLTDDINTLTAQLEARLMFTYKDPERNFDRSRVKGLVAKLITIQNSQYSTALEIVGGGRLYNIVVDNEITSKLLIQKGNLKRRVTILPLNKIESHILDKSKLQQAKNIAHTKGGQANLALELIQYDEEVKKVMEYVFGNTIICDTPALAQEIAFHPHIRTKTVTLEGDNYDPSGTLTGGSNSNSGVLLNKIAQLATFTTQAEALQATIHTLTTTLSKMESVGEAHRDLTRTLERQKQQLEMVQGRLAESSYARITAEIEGYHIEIDTVEKVGIMALILYCTISNAYYIPLFVFIYVYIPSTCIL